MIINIAKTCTSFFGNKQAKNPIILILSFALTV